MRKHRLQVIAMVIAAMTIAATLLSARPSHSQELAQSPRKPSYDELLQKVERLEERVKTLEGLEQKVKVLDRRVEVEQEETRAKSAEVPVISADAKGFSISSPDNAFTLRVGGILQANGSFFTSGSDKPSTGSTFFLNKVRPIFQGTVFRYYDYFLYPDFGQGKTVLQEAWVDSHYFESARVLIGKFKAPFGIERLQSDKDLLFSQRGLTNNLIPNRDIGLELHGDLLRGRLTYQVALQNGVVNNTASTDYDNNDGKDFVGRVFALPFKQIGIQSIEGLGLGFAGSYGDERGPISQYVTAGQSTFFRYASGVTASGLHYRYSPQAYYYAGSFGLLADYVDDTQTANLLIKKGKTLINRYDTFANHAWQAQASWLLTGEDATYYGVKPRRVFNPAEGGWGAWEIKARVGGLGVDSDVFHDQFASTSASARTATEFGGGLNWYLNSNVKFQLEYLRTFFDKGGPGNTDRKDESAFLTQVQLAY